MSQGLQRQLGLGDGIVFAFGSVAGAGILFLPSLIYALAGNDSLLVWIGAVALAFPLLVIMSDMVKRVSDGSGIEGFISLGLGDFAAASVPWLLLTIMLCGGAGSTFVAGRFVDLAFGGGKPVVFGVALAMAIAATVIPASGLSLGRRTQKLITWGTIAFAGAVLALTLPETRAHSFDPIIPTASELRPILRGVVAAFFAFVGLENLTFIAGEFKRPERDFFLASLIAFALYTALLLGLSLVFGVLAAPAGTFDSTAGLVGLAATIEPTLARITALFAVFAVLTNITSWVWGMSRMIYKAAEAGKLPRPLSVMRDGVPLRGVLVAGGLYVVGLLVLIARPEWAVVFLVIVGAVGCMLYLLALASYVRIGRRSSWKVVAVILSAIIVVNLAGVGWPILVPVCVAAASYVFAAVKRTRAS
jgi:amino acid efflux transporter